MRGWAYRLWGQFERASEFYRKALNISVRAGDALLIKRTRGWIYNNILYAYAHLEHKGYGQETENIFRMGERLWEEIDYPRGLGALYTAYMTVKRRKEDYNEALEYGKLAWDIFSPQNDFEWLCKISYELGIVHFEIACQAKEKALKETLERDDKLSETDQHFKQAQNHLERASSYGINMYMAEVEYWLAELYIFKNDPHSAQPHNQTGFKVVREITKEPRYWLHLLSQKAHIANLLPGTEKFDELYKEYLEYEACNQDVPREGPGQAVFFYYLGNIALHTYENNGQDDAADAAIEYYQRGLMNSAKHHTYGPYQLSAFLEEMDTRFKSAKNQQQIIKFRQKLGAVLYEAWAKRGVDRMKEDRSQGEQSFAEQYPGAVVYFLQWQSD
jgi:hypothetical protein